MHVRLPLGRSLFFLAAFLFAVAALLPLRLAVGWFGLDSRGLSAREASGSVWLGMLKEARVGPVPLGDVQARLNTLPLFLGRARVTLARIAGPDQFEGAVTASRHSFGVDDATGRLSAGALFAALPVSSLELEDLTAGFAGELCERAEGRVRATLAGDAAGVGIPTAFSGTARCAEGRLLIPLASQSGMERLNLSVFADGRYRADLVVRPIDESLHPRLAAAGFRPTAGGWLLRLDGSF